MSSKAPAAAGRMAPTSLMAAIERSWPGRWGLDSETSEFGRLVQVGGISPHLAPCTTTALWKKLGPSGPQSYGFLSLEAGSGGQACGLLPHPALFLGGLSIPRNILKGRGESLDLARTQCQEGLHSQADPCPPGELLGFVLRVTDGTQELRTVGRDISEAAS